MRRLIFALALGLLACATAPAGADALQSDPQILLKCVAQAGADRASLGRCNGLVTSACVEAEGGSNSMTDVLYRGAEADVWDELIAEATARITAADAVDGALLATANQASKAWRETECEYRAYEYGGGSGEQLDRIACYLELTSARVIFLTAN